MDQQDTQKRLVAWRVVLMEQWVRVKLAKA
jgi:hypothetical protein